jgi:hypothetical protein
MEHPQDVSPEEFVPLLVPIASFGATLAAIAIVLFYRFRATRLKHELVKAYLDKGEPPPKDLLGGAPSRNADLRRGLVLLATGISLALAFLIQGEAHATGFGLIPALIGGAYLLMWRIERDRSPGEERG